MLRIAGLTAHYQLQLTREGRLDELTVLAECSKEAAADPKTRGRLSQELRYHVKSTTGVSIAAKVLDPGTIQRSGGKAKRVIDRRDGA